MFRVSGSELSHALKTALKFVAKDPARPVLEGVCLDRVGSQMWVVATDSWKMAAIRLETSQEVKATASQVIIDKGAAKTLATNLRYLSALVTWQQHDRVLMGTSGQDTFDVQLIDGQYPAWSSLMNQRQDQQHGRLAFDAGELKVLAKQAKAAKAQLLRFDISPKQTIVRYKTDEGEIERELKSAQFFPEEDREVVAAVSPEHLLPALEGADIVEIPANGVQKPWVFPNGTAHILVMPIRLPEGNAEFRARGKGETGKSIRESVK